MSLSEQQSLESVYLMPTFARKPVEFVGGSGMTLTDDEGKTYLDFVGGIGVISIGHCNPVLADAIADQARTLMHVSNYYYIEGRGQLARTLSDMANAGCKSIGDASMNGAPEFSMTESRASSESASAGNWRVFFSNSGAESNECAIKLARLHAKRVGLGPLVVTLGNGFHGRTLATLAATAQPAKQEAFQPLPAGFIDTPLNDVGALRKLFAAHEGDICAVILEPIQGESGVHPCTAAFMQEVRALTKTSGALMICDEVQCGIYRTGLPFAFQNFGVIPDVITMAKGIGGGMPMGAVAARGDLGLTFAPGDHGTTFGGSCLAVAAANATLDYIRTQNVGENAEKVGAYLRERLETLPHVNEVRGMGLMNAVEFDGAIDAPKLVLAALKGEPGLVLNCTDSHTLRFLPPLTCTRENVDALIDGLTRLLENRA